MRSARLGAAVTVEVPATSANLGPGFDCFGLALDWREQVTIAVLEHGYQIDVSGEGADAIPRDESHLIIRSVLVGLADLGVAAPGLRLSCHNTIPHGRGLGSSAAAIVAGLVAAAGLAETDPEPAWLLRHANAIEGHPDNVAAAIYGGFVLAYEGRDGVSVVRSAVTGSIGAAIFIPRGGGVDQGGAQPAPGNGAARRRRGQLRTGRAAGPRHGRRSGPALRRHSRLAAPELSRAGHAALVRVGENPYETRDSPQSSAGRGRACWCWARRPTWPFCAISRLPGSRCGRRASGPAPRSCRRTEQSPA